MVCLTAAAGGFNVDDIVIYNGTSWEIFDGDLY
jgi:hypothetical protein